MSRFFTSIRRYLASGQPRKDAIAIASSIPVFICINDYLVTLTKVTGNSMYPTLNDDYSEEHVLSDVWSVRKRRFNRGDIVTFVHPNDPGRTLIKRIVALPGDWLRLSNGNYKQLETGQCWVEGDNRGYSEDSSKFGPVPLGLMEARPFAVCWPPTRIRRLKRVEPDPHRVNKDPQVLVDFDRAQMAAEQAEIEKLRKELAPFLPPLIGETDFGPQPAPQNISAAASSRIPAEPPGAASTK